MLGLLILVGGAGLLAWRGGLLQSLTPMQQVLAGGHAGAYRQAAPRGLAGAAAVTRRQEAAADRHGAETALTFDPDYPRGGAHLDSGGTLVVGFAAARLTYAPGTMIHLEGQVYHYESGTGLGGRRVDITTASLEPFISLVTDGGGWFAVDYVSRDVKRWTAFALDVESGANSRMLTFEPVVR